MSHDSTGTIWVGMDVHQESVTAAILYGDKDIPSVVRLPGDLNAVRRMFRTLAKQGTPRGCYEASGAGYVLQRALDHDGFWCEVIAPSLIPRSPGDHRKTDRLDAVRLARMYRSGHLRAVTVPDQELEALRQLVRCRLSLQRQIVRSKQRVVRVLATHGHRFTGTKSNWTNRHRECLAQLRRELHGPLQTVLAHDLDHLEYIESQQRSLDAEIEQWSRREPWRATVEALQCFRGIRTLTAMTLVTEIGDIRRFGHPDQLMGYTGLVSMEHSSGERQNRGSITKAGNSFLRRVLVEAAWHYQYRAGSTLILQRRRMGQNPGVVAIAVKAQQRLSKRFHHLEKTKHRNKVAVAVARELSGFVWAAMMTVATRRS